MSALFPTTHLITLDPGHFHAGLVQKHMYPQISPLVNVYAPEGPDVIEHLKRIERFNQRAENPTHWQERVYIGPDFLERMTGERAGNVVVISGNNARKTRYICQCVSAGMNVLADKPMAIVPENFPLLCETFKAAAEKGLLLFDIMTERYEITNLLQRALAQMPEVLGTLQKGTFEQPAVVMESVHHFFKEVAGKILVRPAWFFDVRQQGESVQDVGTHLVDLAQWICFPDQSLDWRQDVQIAAARRWPSELTPDQFKSVTGLDAYPAFLEPDITPKGVLQIFTNGEIVYRLRDLWVKVAALWNFAAPAGGTDTHFSVIRGTHADLVISQDAINGPHPRLRIRPHARSIEWEQALRRAIARLSHTWPGLDLKAHAEAWEIQIPEKYHIGHEAHFIQVTEKFLQFLAAGKLPDWEAPNMLAKYYTTTEGLRKSRSSTDG